MNITMFTRTPCQRCDATKRRLKDTPFTPVDVDVDEAAAAELRAKGYGSLPVVRVTDAEGNVVDEWSGFNPSKTDAARALVGAGQSKAAPVAA